MKKIISLILAVLMMAAMFAGCQPKTNDPLADKADTTATKAPEATTASEATEAAKPEAKTVTVGYTIYEPMNYKDESGKLIGYDTELAEKVFANLGYTVIFKEIDWKAKYTEVNSGSIDCIWNGFTCNTSDDDGIARADKVDFSYNYMENRQVVVAKKDSGIKTAADLAGKLGAAETGSAGETYGKDTFKDAVIKGFDVQTKCLLEVKSGTANFAILDAQLAKSYCGKGDYADLEIVEGLDSEVEYYAIGFKKGSDLTANVNAQLDALAKDGTIAALADKYGVANTAIKDFADQKK